MEQGLLLREEEGSPGETSWEACTLSSHALFKCSWFPTAAEECSTCLEVTVNEFPSEEGGTRLIPVSHRIKATLPHVQFLIL